MACLTKHLIRVGIIGALGTGAAVLIAGPDRTRALFTQARSAVNDTIDSQITDPVALRAQLKDLEATYPRKIAEVRGDLAELREQTGQLTRDLSVSNRVVTLADEDRAQLLAALDQAQEAQVRTASLSDEQAPGVVILFKNDRLTPDAARSRVDQVAATRNAYASRAADIQRDLGYLSQQESRLGGLLGKLETERSSFQAQLWDLDRQIDAVARNDRMIEILQKRQASIDEQSRYRAASLDQIQAKLSQIRATQESKLDALASQEGKTDYESAARADIDREGSARPVRAHADAKPARPVIEIKAKAATERARELPAPTGPVPAGPAVAKPAQGDASAKPGPENHG